MGAATEPALVNRKAVWLGFRFTLIPFCLPLTCCLYWRQFSLKEVKLEIFALKGLFSHSFQSKDNIKTLNDKLTL